MFDFSSNHMALSMQKQDGSNPEADEMPGSHAAAKRSTFVSLAVNIGLTLAQVAAGIFAGSQALVADAIHSLSDLVSDFVVLYASHHSKKPPSQAYHYGHQRFETAASLIE